MQFHVPFGYVSPQAPSPSAASSVPSSSAHLDAAAPSSASPSSSPGGASTGHAVEQGFLSGRRLAVRLAPQGVAPPSGPGDFAFDSGERPAAVIAPVPSSFTSAAPVTYGAGRADESMYGGAPVSPPQQQSTSTTAAPASTARYGGGIVRISDLQRRGGPAVESGLRLATLQGGRPAATIRSSRDADDDQHRPLADVFAPASASAAAGGDASTRRAARGQGRGRGGRRASERGAHSGRASRGSVQLELAEDGGLPDYRWFMARGRRCLMYNGEVFKGTKAHKLWIQIKRVKEERGQAGQRQPRAPSASAASTTRQAAALTAGARSRAHQFSARAVSATQRILQQEAADTAARRVLPATLSNSHIGGSNGDSGNAARVSDAWRQLMDELGVDYYPDLHQAVSAHGGTSPRGEPPRASQPDDVVEITDSSGASSAFSSSTDDSFSETSSSESDSDTKKASVSSKPAMLHWPTTSYFSDASSGWSSGSSPAAPGSPVQPRCASPPAKKVKKGVSPASTAAHAFPSPPRAVPPSTAQVRIYNGVEVVEEDGWLYPKEVYASQQEAQQRNQAVTVPITTASVSSSSVRTRPCDGDNDSYAVRRRPGVLLNDEDVPLSEVFTQPSAPATTALRTASQVDGAVAPVRGAASTVNSFPPAPAIAPGKRPAGGLAVILGGQVGAVSLRPAASVHPHGHGAPARELARDSAVLRAVDDDTSALDGFDGADVADMFVTAEEIGGVRYGA